MSKKDEFVNFIDTNVNWENASEDIINYWNIFKGKEEKEKPLFTDNGKLILKFMQEHISDMPMGKARDIAEGLFISSRTVSGAMRKLVIDEYVEKIGENPTIYSLTEKGKNYIFED